MTFKSKHRTTVTSSGSVDSGYEESHLFCSPEEGCTKSFVYHRNLEHLLDTGKHVYRQKRPVTDDVKEMWIDRVREVKMQILKVNTRTEKLYSTNI